MYLKGVASPDGHDSFACEVQHRVLVQKKKKKKKRFPSESKKKSVSIGYPTPTLPELCTPNSFIRVQRAGKIGVGSTIDTDFFFITFSIRRETSSSSSFVQYQNPVRCEGSML